MLLGRRPADLGIGPGAETTGHFAPDVELDVGVTHQKRLGVGVEGDELHAPHSGLDHSVDGVDPTATDSYHFDHGQIAATR